jgi:hypothetical protein
MISAETESRVARHQARDPDTVEAAFLTRRLNDEREIIATSLEHLPSRPQNLVSLMRKSHREAGFLHHLRPDSPEIRVALHRMARAAKALCDLAAPGIGAVKVSLGDEVPSFMAERARYRFSVGDFTKAFYAAIAVRDAQVIDALLKVDVDQLQMSGLLFEDYSFLWARALQCWFRGDGNTVDVLTQALEATDPDKLKHGSQAYALFIACLEMELMSTSMVGAERFNRTLHKALAEGHKIYYGQIEANADEDQSDEPEGFIALGPLAFACAMHDRGWPITVKSDYLPVSIIENR